MMQADGSLTQPSDNYINYMAQADWFLLPLQPMSLLLKFKIVFCCCVRNHPLLTI